MKDNEKFLFYLQKYVKETGISILAYCLMENHVHLLVHDSHGNISVFMKKMGVSYARYYNRKYGHTGHVFHDRYKSEVVKDDAYLMSVYRHILNNPAKSGICRADEYTWSSYREYGKTGVLTDTEILSELIGSGDSFQKFMLELDGSEHMEDEPQKKDDAWALKMIRDELKVSSVTQLQKFDRQKRNEALALMKKKGITIRQLERLTGINRGVIQRA